MKTKNFIKSVFVITAIIMASGNLTLAQSDTLKPFVNIITSPKDTQSIRAVEGASPSSMSFGYNGGSRGGSVTALYEWGIISCPGWLSVSPSDGFNGTTSITVTCSPNTSTNSRSGTISFGFSSESGASISVTQAGNQPTNYTVTASAGSGGTISPSSVTVISGGTATFTASPNTGYYTSGCSGGSLSGNTVTVNNVTSNRSVSVSFSRYTYTVTASAGSGGTISPSSVTVTSGGTATFTASPNTGYYTSGCSGGSLSGNTVTASNVTSNRSVSVSFSQTRYTVTAVAGPGGTVSPASQTVTYGGTAIITATPNSGYYTSGCSEGPLSGNTITVSNVTSNKSVYVSFSPLPTYTVTASAGSGGTISPSSVTVISGGTATFTASPNTGYYTSGCSGGSLSGNTVTVSNVTSNRSLSVSFSPLPTYTITVTPNPPEGGSPNGGGNFLAGVTASLVAGTSSGYAFVNWTENGTPVSTDSKYTFTVDRNRDLVANFATCKLLTHANPPEGGSITGNPLGYYPKGTVIELHANKNPGYAFINWTENGNVVSTNEEYLFPLNTDRELVANFATCHLLTRANPSEGGTVTGNPLGYYPKGTVIELHANKNPGYAFINWTENGNVVSTNEEYLFPLNTDRELVANFNLICSLLVSAEPSEGGTITGNQNGNYPKGSNIDLLANENPGYAFINWTENGNEISTNKRLMFTINTDRELVANFATCRLFRRAEPSEGGTITGNQNGNYPKGSNIELIANKNPGYAFINWTENGNEISTNERLMFAINNDRELVANFATCYLLTRANPSEGGTITGNSNGNYPKGSNIELIANKNPGYAFINWTENGNEISTNERLMFAINNDRELVANFIRSQYTISGHVSTNTGTNLDNLTISLSNSGGSATTDANGNYIITVSSGWNGTATPSFSGYTFNPPDRTYPSIGSNQTGQDYVATPVISYYTISGHITKNTGENLAGVTISLNNSGGSATTDVNGNYSITVSSGWNGTATPSLGGYTFNPPNRTYPSIGSNQTGQDYVGTENQGYCTLTTFVNPSEGGSITGNQNGNYPKGSNIDILANKNPGYAFINWTENDTVVSTNERLTFAINRNRNLVANFATCYLLTQANPSEGGTITGNPNGNYPKGSNIDILANENPGYAFINWTEGTTVVSTEKNYKFTINTDRELVANFATCRLLRRAEPSEGGAITGNQNGNYPKGSNIDLLANENPGYTFINWTENGNEISTNERLMFTINTDRELVANFSRPQYTISGYIKAATLTGETVADVVMTGFPGPSIIKTDGSGYYSASVPKGWSGTIKPILDGWVFLPASTPYNIVISNQEENYLGVQELNLQMTASAYEYTGTITAIVNLNGGPQNRSGILAAFAGSECRGLTNSSMLIDARRVYFLTVYSNTTPVTLSFRFYTNDMILPIMQTMNFTSDLIAGKPDAPITLDARDNFEMWGYIKLGSQPIAGVEIKLIVDQSSQRMLGNSKTSDLKSNASTNEVIVTTDSTGYYTYNFPYNWKGVAIPVLEGYTFEPDTIAYNGIVEDMPEQNYNADKVMYAISGSITQQNGVPLPGVTVGFSDIGEVITDANGIYIKEVGYGWSGTVTPKKGGYNFEPENRTYNVLLENSADENFSACKLELGTILPTFLVAPNDGSSNANFGYSVAVSDKFAVIGKSYSLGKGAVYIYELIDNRWQFKTKLIPENTDSDFGRSVAIYNEYLIIGSEYDNENRGAVYIYKYDGNTWAIKNRIVADDGNVNDRFGCSVDINEQYAVVGAYGCDFGSFQNVGAVYFFKNVNDNWVFHSKNFGSSYSTYKNRKLAQSVSLSSNYAMAGSPYFPSSIGSVEVFKLTGESWNYHKLIYASNGHSGDNFGSSVSIDNGRAIIGAKSSSSNGYACVYELNNSNTWVYKNTLTPSKLSYNGYFGNSVSICGDYIAVGEYGGDISPNDNNIGSVYVYKYENGSWNEINRLFNKVDNYKMGWAVSLSGINLLVGSLNGSTGPGSVYLYTNKNYLNPHTISGVVRDNNGVPRSNCQIQFSDHFIDTTDANGSFEREVNDGWSGIITPSLFGWGFSPETKNLTDLSTDSLNLSFIVSKNIINTDRQVKILNPTALPNGSFGLSVSINGDFAAVGSKYDNERHINAGAVYIYKMENGTWNRKNKIMLEPSNPSTYFGTLVELSKNYLIISKATDSVYIYKRINDSTWTINKRIYAGYSISWPNEKRIAINDDYAVVTEGQCAYIYRRNNDTWSYTTKIYPSQYGGAFGKNISLNENNFVIIGDQGLNNDQGTAYIYKLEGTGYCSGYLVDYPSPPDFSKFGYSVSVDGDYAIVGAPSDSYYGQGKVYIFKYRGGIYWDYIKTVSNDQVWAFGDNVNICNNSFVVLPIGAMKAFIYNYDNNLNDWLLQNTISTSEYIRNADISKTSLILGVPEDDQVANNSGAVYIFGGGEESNQNIKEPINTDGKPGLPKEFSLSPNYPNPFNPTTTIKFGLPQKSFVKLTIYNIVGQVVKELINKEMSEGYHQVEFNASNLASGIYFYRINAGNFSQTKKFILMK